MFQSIPFEQIEVGMKSELVHRVTREDVQAFVALTGDSNPLHIDETYANRTMFHKPVVHGMLSASFISTIIGTMLPGGGALWMSQNLEFLQPAFVGDTLHITARVRQKSPAIRTIVLAVTITNQHEQTVIQGEGTVKVLDIDSGKKVVKNDSKKIILISGGSGGIGSATARLLARQGHTVIINTRLLNEKSEQLLEDIQNNGGKGLLLPGDISKPEDVAMLFRECEKNFGAVQALVHCASPINRLSDFENLSWDSFQLHLDIQVKGAFNLAQAALPSMLSAAEGAMVFMGSTVIDGVPPLHQTDYTVAKAALTSLAHCLALEYGPKGIRVNIVAPGMVETGMISHLPEKARMLTKMQTPLRQLAGPEQVASVIEFLLSPASSHITGETIRVAGGAVML